MELNLIFKCKHVYLVFILFPGLLGSCRSPARTDWPDFSLPTGFKVTVFAEGVGKARHMVTRSNGTVYVRLRRAKDGFCNVALRDDNQDGRADLIRYFGKEPCGTGLAIKEPYLYPFRWVI